MPTEETQTHPTQRLTGPTEHAPELTGPTPDQPRLTGPTTVPPPDGRAGAERYKAPDEHKAPEEHAPEQKPADKGGRGRLWRIALILLVIFGILFVIGVLPRLHQRPELKKDAQAQKNTTPAVSVAPVRTPPPFDELDLPGNVQAIQQTAIVARASGYLRRTYADIGDTVRAGQLLATIETPDLDQQVAQAQAQVVGSRASLSQAGANVTNLQGVQAQAQANLSRSDATYAQAKTDLARARAALTQAQDASAQQRAQLAQAQANLNLARVTAQRYENLLSEGAIDQQTTDQAVAAAETNAANVEALRSALRASEANIAAFRAAVGSSQANVQAYAEGIRASRAAVDSARANVQAGRDNVGAAAANVRSNQANVARYASLQGFSRVIAPFAGVITARNVDTGALISTTGGAAGGDSSSVGNGGAGATSLGNAAGGSAVGGGSSPGGGGSQSPSLFSLAQIDTLRIYLSVPQNDAGTVRVGQQAQVSVRELPGQTFTGAVTRTAGALDAASRTLVSEVRLANPRGILRPGMFAQVRLRVPHPTGALLVPDPALVTNAAGSQVIVVGQDNKIHFQTVTTGRDFGQVTEVLSGLQAGQQVVANPSDSLHEGETVKTQPAPPPPKQ